MCGFGNFTKLLTGAKRFICGSFFAHCAVANLPFVCAADRDVILFLFSLSFAGAAVQTATGRTAIILVIKLRWLMPASKTSRSTECHPQTGGEGGR